MLLRSLSKFREVCYYVFTLSYFSLKVGDFALFLKDSRGNFLALSFDDRIYYLSHVSAEKFTDDISKKSQSFLHSNLLLSLF